MISVREIALKLAKQHREADKDTAHIFWVQHNSIVRLIEITSYVLTSGEIYAWRYRARPDLDIPYPLEVIFLSLEEWNIIKEGKLSLPEGWHINVEVI